MTINTSTNRTVATGNGATTIWNYGFLIPDATEVVVQITDKTTGVVTTLTNLQYAITGIGNALGGTVTYTPALTTNQTITIQRILPVVQGTSLSNQGALYPVTIETALDYLTMVSQQLNDSISRALVVSPNGVTTVDAGNNRIINLIAPVNANDAARLVDVQNQVAGAGNVPLPTLGQVGQFLKATGTGLFGWTAMTAAAISDATASGIALLTAASVAAQRIALGLTTNALTFSAFQRSGTAGQVWASAGAGADAAYVGGMTLLASGTVSAAATLDLVLPTGYKTFKLYLYDYKPVTNAQTINIRFSYDNGVSYIATGSYAYAYVYNLSSSAGTAGEGHGVTQTSIISGFAVDNSSNFGNNMNMDIFPGTATSSVSLCGQCFQLTGSAVGNMAFSGSLNGSLGRVTNMRFLFGSGNISTLTYALYGLI